MPTYSVPDIRLVQNTQFPKYAVTLDWSHRLGSDWTVGVLMARDRAGIIMHTAVARRWRPARKRPSSGPLLAVRPG